MTFLEKHVPSLSHDKTRLKFDDSAASGDGKAYPSGRAMGEVGDQVSFGMALSTPLGHVEDGEVHPR